MVANAVLLFVAAPNVRAQLPSVRACHALASFPPSGGVVLIGGARECGVGVLPDTAMWRWDGRAWSVVGPFTPGAREDALVTFDSRRGRLVLYGGRNGPRVFTDTWEWDGRTWSSHQSAQNPGPLEHAAIAFDSARGRVVVFGGGSRTGTRSARTWEWDGREWTVRAEAGPPARVGHSMAWSPAHRAVLMYGGFAARQFVDLWKWSGTAWAQLSDRGPAETEGPSLVAFDRALLLIGTPPGTTGSMRTWRIDDATFDPVQSAMAPSPTVGPAVAYDAVRRRVVWYGGGTVWEFDGAQWARVELAR
ncbi:MAG: hypothetical protein H7066_21990 [Cytophagaceae bacterium]|nr:hypothetical protein [Gemmatimonadaceae bacterium]